MTVVKNSIPLWIRIPLFPFAWICYIFIYAWAKIVLWYDFEFTDRAFKRKLKTITTKRDLVDRIKALVLDFNEVGKRSLFIPKQFKTKKEVYDHILYWYGSDLEKHGIFLSQDLKIVELPVAQLKIV